MKKIIAMLLSLLTVASFAVGCNTNDSASNSVGGNTSETDSSSESAIPVTGDNIVENGATE